MFFLLQSFPDLFPQIIQYSIPPFWSVWVLKYLSFHFFGGGFLRFTFQCFVANSRGHVEVELQKFPRISPLCTVPLMPPNPLGNDGKERGKNLQQSGVVFFKASIIKWHDMAFFFRIIEFHKDLVSWLLKYSRTSSFIFSIHNGTFSSKDITAA